MWFELTKAQLATLKQIAVQLASSETPVILALPSAPKEDDATSTSTSKLNLAPDTTGIKQGSTAPYSISAVKGSNLKQVASIRYLGTQLAIHFNAAFTSVTIDQMPANLSANPGVAQLEVRLTDGSKQFYSVIVSKP